MVRHDNRTEKFKSIWTVKTQTTLSFLTLMLALNVMDPVSQNKAMGGSGGRLLVLVVDSGVVGASMLC